MVGLRTAVVRMFVVNPLMSYSNEAWTVIVDFPEFALIVGLEDLQIVYGLDLV